MVTTLDKYGRLIIPKKFREHLGITKNTNLDIKEEGKRIIIEPIQAEDILVNKDGILVYAGSILAETDELLKMNRDNRINRLLNEDEN